jgi:hypothetical protein
MEFNTQKVTPKPLVWLALSGVLVYRV